MTDKAQTHDELARHLLTVAIERRHFSGAALNQFAVDLLRHCLTAIEDRAALCAEQSSHALYDTTEVARRHMRGEP